MFRRLFNVFAVMSLVLWLTALCFYVRGKWVEDKWTRDITQHNAPPYFSSFYVIQTTGDLLSVRYHSLQTSDANVFARSLPSPTTPWLHQSRPHTADYEFLWTPEYSDADESGLSSNYRILRRELDVPYWNLLIVFAILPAIWLAIRLFRRRRIFAGCCPVCSYDLRATPDRCPECGHSPPPSPAV